MKRSEIERIAAEAERLDRVVGVRIVVPEDEDQEPWTLPPSGTPVNSPIKGVFPESISLVLGNQVYIILADQLESLPEDQPRIIVATGRYIGEGFDDARLDTLFLALPVSWRGTLAQYAGRLHRLHHSKKEVLIYDYADLKIPMLARMFERRKRGYRAIGYEIE
jgi:hypothetical protein